MTAAQISDWHDFAVALAGATAALAGLLFVAVSMSLEPILKASTLPRLAAGTLMLFVFALLGSLMLLIPDQGATALGLELTMLAVTIGASMVAIHTRRPFYEYTSRNVWLFSRLVPSIVIPTITVVGGIVLMSGSVSGVKWFVAASMLAIVTALVHAWVLLIEIHR